MDRYFFGMVYMKDCMSWYKVNGKIIGFWLGSSLYVMKMFEYFCWEDYEYFRREGGSELEWIGNGWILEDVNRGSLGYYVDFVDILLIFM